KNFRNKQGLESVSISVLLNAAVGFYVSHSSVVAALSASKKNWFCSMAASAHVSRIRSLYKRILVLHRFLPIHLRALGDQYVKEEFRRHKSAAPEEVKSFLSEWE
ncbi:hypothetical protein XENORESO_012557, partial [Xenotaenia resolanae]